MTAGDVQQPALGQPLPHVQTCIYLDYNATTPIFPEVANAMAPFLFQHFGNPSSGHTYGKTCKDAVVKARGQVAALINADSPSEVYFTSCGTESDNWAIYGAVMAKRAQLGGSRPAHVVASAVEHPAVIEYLSHLQAQGLATFTLVPVDAEGRVSVADVEAALEPSTALVTLMHSNNEVGSLQPVADVAQVARQRGVLVHCDAAQSLGKVPVDVQALGVDMLTVVGHKFGAPKGVAALYIRSGVSFPNYFHGGGQEAGRRAGTENVLLVVGLGQAAEVATREAAQTTAHMRSLRDRLQAALTADLHKDTVRINGPSDDSQRLPNTLSISIKGLNASVALQRLSAQLAASAGAACHSHDGPTVSGVLKAMKVPVEYALGTLRLSTGRHTTAQDVDEAARLILAEAAAQGIA